MIFFKSTRNLRKSRGRPAARIATANSANCAKTRSAGSRAHFPSPLQGNRMKRRGAEIGLARLGFWRCPRRLLAESFDTLCSGLRPSHLSLLLAARKSARPAFGSGLRPDFLLPAPLPGMGETRNPSMPSVSKSGRERRWKCSGTAQAPQRWPAGRKREGNSERKGPCPDRRSSSRNDGRRRNDRGSIRRPAPPRGRRTGSGSAIRRGTG